MRANFDLLDDGYGDRSKSRSSSRRVSYFFSADPQQNEWKLYELNGNIHEVEGDTEGGCIETFVSHVTESIEKTDSSPKSHQRRSRLIHLFYIIALPMYTILGAIAFQHFDSAFDDRALREYENRCSNELEAALNATRNGCFRSSPTSSSSEDSCSPHILVLDKCFRDRSYVNFPSHTMSDFTNAIIYAISVYTTIGYGNIAADTVKCRVATILYAIIGIPLFFAFLKDMGQLFSHLFIRCWRGFGYIRKVFVREDEKESPLSTLDSLIESSILPAQISMKMDKSVENAVHVESRIDHHFYDQVREQRKVFLWAVVFLIIYFLAVSWLFQWIEPKWDFLTAFYFLFTSVALIGFGDEFPSQPKVVLVNFAFIVLGIVLFGMCYFILQEEIREKAFAASRRVRNSIMRRQQSYRRRGGGHPQTLDGHSEPVTPSTPSKSLITHPSAVFQSQTSRTNLIPSEIQHSKRNFGGESNSLQVGKSPSITRKLSGPLNTKLLKDVKEWSTVV